MLPQRSRSRGMMGEELTLSIVGRTLPGMWFVLGVREGQEFLAQQQSGQELLLFCILSALAINNVRYDQSGAA